MLVWGIVIHLAVDWLLQNRWMADNKHRLIHPAAYLHAGLHAAALLMIFPPAVALAVGVTHLIIDTRVPLTVWKRFMSQSGQPDLDVHLAIWRDQTLHVVVLAGAALLSG